MGLRVGEMMALRLIVFWNVASTNDLSADGRAIARKALNRSIDQLFRWYRLDNVVDADIRFGTLMLLLPAFVVCIIPVVRSMHPNYSKKGKHLIDSPVQLSIFFTHRKLYPGLIENYAFDNVYFVN
jgi:lysophospholipase L1-like esterase